MKFRSALVAVCSLFVLSTTSLAAQETTPTAAADSAAPLRVFVDCSYFCDLDFIRTEMPWVDYMRDRADAQVHILVTQQSTGGGGSRYTLNFIGLRDFAAVNDTLYYTSSSNDSQDVTRRGLTRMMQVGIMPFVARTPLGQRIRITLANAEATAPVAAPRNDPWNFWNFTVRFSGNGNGESESDSKYFSGSVGANRTTEQWKMSLSLNSNQNIQRFTFPISETRDTTQKFFSRSSSVNGSLVKSLGANFSAGERQLVALLRAQLADPDGPRQRDEGHRGRRPRDRRSASPRARSRSRRGRRASARNEGSAAPGARASGAPRSRAALRDAATRPRPAPPFRPSGSSAGSTGRSSSRPDRRARRRRG
mgnify:CR=1 FL=1